MKKPRKPQVNWSKETARAFFANSSLLDRMVLRAMAHVHPNWEMIWDPVEEIYIEEADSFAGHMNVLIDNISNVVPPENYHFYENKNAALYSEVASGKFALSKNERIWIDTTSGDAVPKDMVGHMIEQATAGYDDIPDSVFAAAGRVAKAMKFGSIHFDVMEWGHMEMLAVIMMDILFRRSNDIPSEYVDRYRLTRQT